MPYYSGDYYQGDYYQGDNYGGFAAGGFSLKKLLTPPKAIRSLVEGLPVVGTALKTARAIASIGSRAPSGTSIGTPGILQPFHPADEVPRPGVRGTIQRILPFGETGYIKRRRLNPLNLKALRRAMRRAKGFERQARRVGSFFRPGFSYRLKGRRPKKK